MPLRPQLLTEIQAALGAAMLPCLTVASAASDIFEVYVFTIVIEAARAEGAQVTFRNVDGVSTSSLTFRTSPGFIWSKARPYTHAVIRFADKPALECHVGVYVTGNSGVLHEADVAVIYSDEAETCRREEVAPRSKRVVLGAECKFYTTLPGLHLGRGFLGLCADMTGRDLFFVMNTTAASIEKLLSCRHRAWDHEIVPGSSTVVRLRSSFQTVFKNFKTTGR
jgi:hypothetical protein